MTGKGIFLAGILILGTTLGAVTIHLNPSEDPFFKKYRPKVLDELKKRSVHQPFRQAKCTACHVSIEKPKKMKSKLKVLCLECHEDQAKEKKKKKVHKSFKDCGECHKPHSSDNRALLVEERSTLCQDCHETDEDEVMEKHEGIIPRYNACIECHNVHASNRGKGLIQEGKLHKPFAEKKCDECHDKADGEGQVRLKNGAGGLVVCGGCHEHEKMVKKMASEENRHSPARWGSCVACHSAHVETSKPMLKEKTVSELCLNCHKAIKPGNHPVNNHPTRLEGKTSKLSDGRVFDCDACHDPHGSEHSALRRVKEKGFCIACHDKK